MGSFASWTAAAGHTGLPAAADVVIVGGGSAGCALASRLSEDASLQVLLLEAGPTDRNVLVHCPAGLPVMAMAPGHAIGANWNFTTEPQPGLLGRRGYQPRGKVLGGSSSINAMVYLRGQAADYDGWAAEGNPGWSFAEVLPYFKRSEGNRRGADALHGSDGPLSVQDLMQPNPVAARFIEAAHLEGLPLNQDFNGPTQEGAGFYQVTHRGGERCSSAKGYLGLAAGRPNLQVATGVHATRVVFEGRRATGVACLLDGQPHEVRARREVVLSAGALQTPQLLMLSGVGPAAELQRHGLPVVLDLPGVGANLHDHPDVVLQLSMPGEEALFGVSPRGLLRLPGDVLQWRRERRGRLTTNFAEAGAFWRSRPQAAEPDTQIHFVVGMLKDHGRKPVLGLGCSLHVCALHPKSRGRLTLTSRDPRAAPRIDPAFLDHPDDLAVLVAGIQRTRRILAQRPMAELGGREWPTSAGAHTEAAIADFVRRHADTIYHPVGTCRMGPEAASGAVVDAQLRVHGLDALRVIDASVMPSIVGGNTNAPTLMIAEKAADLMRGRPAPPPAPWPPQASVQPAAA